MIKIFDITNSDFSTQEVAKYLLGTKLISETPEGITAGWIVETEAYLGAIDKAAHTYQYRSTPRVEAMYNKAGTIYLYNMMGNILLNIVTKEKGNPEAVLIRAVQPAYGIDLMEQRRGKKKYEMTNGPGKMTQAMGITMAEYGQQITSPPLYIDCSNQRKPKSILTTPRIGIPNKEEWTKAPLRYIVKGNPYVSRKRGKMDIMNDGWKV